MQPYPRLASFVLGLSGLAVLPACDETGVLLDCDTTAARTEQCLSSSDGACLSGEDATVLFNTTEGDCYRDNHDVAPGCAATFTRRVEPPRPDTGWQLTECCYEAVFIKVHGPTCVIGRPLRMAGHAVHGAVLSGPNRSASTLSPQHARALARAWSQIASLEHAAVTAFARAERLLTAWGAPASLIEATRQARRDEVQHTRAAFALAGRYAGRTLRPAPLPDPGDTPTLNAFAIETLHDAAIGEAVAAAQAAASLKHATDPQVRGLLTQIIRDESKHAALGLATLQWCMEAGGAEVIEAVRAEPLQAPALPPLQAPAHHAVLRSHGLLPGAELARATRQAHLQVAIPAVTALLQARS